MIELVLHAIVHTASTTTAEGTIVRTVDCENCGYSFTYLLTRTMTVRRVRPIGSTAEGRRKQKLGDANRQALNVFGNDCDPVPCPSCGWFQSHMIARVRGILGKSYQSRVRLIGQLLLVAAAIASYPSLISIAHGIDTNDWQLIGIGFLAAVPSVIATFFGVRMIRRRNGLLRMYDPNADEMWAERKSYGKSREREALEYLAQFNDVDGEYFECS